MRAAHRQTVPFHKLLPRAGSSLADLTPMPPQIEMSDVAHRVSPWGQSYGGGGKHIWSCDLLCDATDGRSSHTGGVKVDGITQQVNK